MIMENNTWRVHLSDWLNARIAERERLGFRFEFAEGGELEKTITVYREEKEIGKARGILTDYVVTLALIMASPERVPQ